MHVSRRRFLRIGAAASLAGLTSLLPGTAVQANAPPPPLPDSVLQGLSTLGALGFDDAVSVYQRLRPTIEIQPAIVLAFAGLTEAWPSNRTNSASIRLRADLEGCPPMLAAILAHELLHVWQFTYQPEVYARCVEREVQAYRREAAVLRAWCTANPSDQYGLPVSNIYLMSVVEHSYPVDLETFARESSCGLRT